MTTQEEIEETIRTLKDVDPLGIPTGALKDIFKAAAEIIEKQQDMIKQLKDFEWFEYDVLPEMSEEHQALFKIATTPKNIVLDVHNADHAGGSSF